MYGPPPDPRNSSLPKPLTRFAWLLIAAASATIALKTAAFALTDSVGLLSDALESGVNLVAAVAALVALSVAARPADEQHLYGHSKAEYFSAGVEGALILVAAGAILVSASSRLMDPRPLEQVGPGLAIAVVPPGSTEPSPPCCYGPGAGTLIEAVLARYRASDGVRFHALRTRDAGARRFVSVHVLVPGSWTVQVGHDLLERLEAELDTALGGASVFTHLEPLEDPKSWADGWDHPEGPSPGP